MSPRSSRRSPARRFPVLAAGLALGVTLLAGLACDRRPVTAVDRETFIRAYTEVRVAALENEEAIPTEAQREAILSRFGVTKEQMVEFVEAHGADTDYMQALWNEIEQRLDVDSLAGT